MAQLANCPSCRRDLRVPDALVGQAVRCPDCATIFTTSADGSPGTVVTPAPTVGNGGNRRVEDIPAPSSTPESPALDERDIAPDPESRPRRRPSRYRRRDVEPHRGTTILILGILALVVAPIILGPIAWILGNTDIKKIRAGTMDPEGQGNTNAGRICGIIATIYGLVSCLCGVMMMVIWFIAMATTIQNTPPPNVPPPRPPAPQVPRPPFQPNRPGQPRPSIEDDDFEQSLSHCRPLPGIRFRTRGNRENGGVSSLAVASVSCC